MSASAAIAPRMSVDEFLVWAAARPGRYELDSGVVVRMAPERTRHAEAKFRVQSSLDAAIRNAGLPCRMLPDGMTVRINQATAYEPDALVYCGPRLPGDAVEVPAPVVVVEVLSPSTATRDMSTKLEDYFKLASVAHYLIIDADSRALIHHARGPDAVATRILRDGALRLDPPGLVLDVAEICGASDETASPDDPA